MPVQMLIINFKFNMSPADYIHMVKPLVPEVLNAPGLRWKIWLLNEPECKAGGLYLFDDAEHVQLFLASEIMNKFRSHSAFTDFYITSFDLLESQTKATHGPLGFGVKV